MAKLCEDFIRGSGLPPYSKPTLMGFWRIFLYRESQVTKQALISLVVSEGQGEMPDTLKHEIVKKFSNALETRKVVSISLIYSSEISGGYKETDRVESLLGPGYYEEILLGITFRVSPFAFF